MGSWNTSNTAGRPLFLNDEERKTAHAREGGWAVPGPRADQFEILVCTASGTDMRSMVDPAVVTGAELDQTLNVDGQVGKLYVYMSEPISIVGVPLYTTLQVTGGVNVSATLNSVASGVGNTSQFSNKLVFDYTNPAVGNTLYLSATTNVTLNGATFTDADSGGVPSVNMVAPYTANTGADAAGSVLIV